MRTFDQAFDSVFRPLTRSECAQESAIFFAPVELAPWAEMDCVELFVEFGEVEHFIERAQGVSNCRLYYGLGLSYLVAAGEDGKEALLTDKVNFVRDILPILEGLQ